MPARAALAEEARLPGSVTDGLPGLASFRAAYPGYDDTDYTGAGLPAQAQLSAHAARLNGRCFGNPHSENPTSAASTRLIERAHDQTRTVTGVTTPMPATGWYLNLHQGSSNNILSNGQPTIFFRPLLCANI
jgi:hypothetical protein